MKQIIDLRPVYHRLEERIRAHVILCWLALLLIRIIETSRSPPSPSPNETCSPSLRSPRPSSSSTSSPHPAEQREHHRLEKRPPGAHNHVSTDQDLDSGLHTAGIMSNPGW
jgi:hypothetical protein